MGNAILQIGIKNRREFFLELVEVAGRVDKGCLPGMVIGHLYFDSVPALLKNFTAKRLEIFSELRQKGPTGITSLAKCLHRQSRSIHYDIELMETLGIVGKDAGGRYYARWNEIRVAFTMPLLPGE